MTSGITNISPLSDLAMGSKPSQTNNKTVSKDEFLKMLTFQLKSQNPLKPYDNQEFAAQLAQFSQLEQLTDIRSLLEEQAGSNSQLARTITDSAIPGMLGKYARASTNKLAYDGENSVACGFSLPFAAISGILKIRDESGNVIREVQLDSGELATGEHTIKWDGEDSDGNNLASGNYTFEVECSDKSGSTFSADTFSYGEIQAVRFKSDGTRLVINGMEVPLENVTDISTRS